MPPSIRIDPCTTLGTVLNEENHFWGLSCFALDRCCSLSVKNSLEFLHLEYVVELQHAKFLAVQWERLIWNSLLHHAYAYCSEADYNDSSLHLRSRSQSPNHVLLSQQQQQQQQNANRSAPSSATRELTKEMQRRRVSCRVESLESSVLYPLKKRFKVHGVSVFETLWPIWHSGHSFRQIKIKTLSIRRQKRRPCVCSANLYRRCGLYSGYPEKGCPVWKVVSCKGNEEVKSLYESVIK